MRPPDAVLRFAARVLAWLVPCFALWYWAAPWYHRPAAWLSQGWIGLFRGGLLEAIEFEGSIVTFVTQLEVRQDASGASGVLLVDVNPLLSSYGAPLFAALLLASRGGVAKLALGLAILLPFQAWGIAFDFVTQIIRMSPESAVKAGILGWRAEFAALAYQLGSLIFPTLAPLATWAVLQRKFIAELVADR